MDAGAVIIGIVQIAHVGLPALLLLEGVEVMPTGIVLLARVEPIVLLPQTVVEQITIGILQLALVNHQLLVVLPLHQDVP